MWYEEDKWRRRSNRFDTKSPKKSRLEKTASHDHCLKTLVSTDAKSPGEIIIWKQIRRKLRPGDPNLEEKSDLGFGGSAGPLLTIIKKTGRPKKLHTNIFIQTTRVD